MFLLIGTILALVGICHPLSCSNELKQGPYRLNVADQKLPNITTLTLKIMKVNVSENEIDFFLGYRSRWTSYCYQGGALDPNTGCFDALTAFPPSAEELSKWGRLGQCETCHDYSNAWGSDSSVCLQPIKACGVWHTRKELEKKSTNNNFAYHTCELSWRCGISTSKVPIKLRQKENKEFVVSVALPNGTYVSETNFFLMDGSTSVLLGNIPKPKLYYIEAKCVENDNHYWCVDPDNAHGIVLTYAGDQSYCLYSTCYKFWGVLKPKLTKEENERHASLEDLRNQFATEMVNIEDLKYTTLQLAHRTLLMENIMRKMINSLSKIDDKLISKILGGSFSTEFLDEDSFLIKPCLKDPDQKSNCVGNKIFRDGRWVINKNKANCITLSKSKTIDLFEALDVWLPEISEQKNLGTPDDYTGWSFYANEKDNLQETMEYTRNGGKGTSLDDILNMPGGALARSLAGLWGLSLTSILLFVGAGIIFVIVCKKL